MEPWHLHDLRRTFATQLRSLGIDRLVVSKLLNHAEGGVTKIYDRYTADPEKAAAMERWANRLREIISGAPADNVVQMRTKFLICSPRCSTSPPHGVKDGGGGRKRGRPVTLTPEQKLEARTRALAPQEGEEAKSG